MYCALYSKEQTFVINLFPHVYFLGMLISSSSSIKFITNKKKKIPLFEEKKKEFCMLGN